MKWIGYTTIAKTIHMSETGLCAVQDFSCPKEKYGTDSDADCDKLRYPISAKGLL